MRPVLPYYLFRLALCLAGAGLVPPLAADSGARAPAKAYELQPLDLLKIQVFQEPDLDREVRISKTNSITLPLIGVVDLKGRNVSDAEKIVTELYKRDFLVNPQVNVTIIEYAPRTVNVLGAVNAPGQVLIPPETTMTLIDAISRSGGFARIASRGRVVVTRTFSDGRTENYTVNAEDLMVGGSTEQWLMMPGDVVFVPERIL
ncbi:MAG: polysaccharide biosynthesis/export family protein [Opitutaceae bacterium]|nr:polysaccharide biosynthesis/export family protein [Opitutaceae bacterium]